MELTGADRENMVRKIKDLESVAKTNNSRAVASGGESAEAYRTDEWRYLKGLEEVSEEVEIEVEGEPARSVKYYGRTQSMERGFFKRLRKAIKRIVTIPSCESSTDLDFIKGVNEGDQDDWTRYIAVNNVGNSCAVTSATMILRYHGRKLGAKSLYPESDAYENGVYGIPKRENPTGGNIPLFNDLYNNMSTENWQLIDFGIDGDHEDMNGTAPWNADDGINAVMRNAGVRGKAEWLRDDTQLNWLSLLDTDLFDVFQEHVRMHMPPMVLTLGGSGWPGQHYMPVLGTKKTRYNIWCLRLNEHYVYVHATGKTLSDKRYYRFDARAYPLAIWSGVTVTVSR